MKNQENEYDINKKQKCYMKKIFATTRIIC